MELIDAYDQAQSLYQGVAGLTENSTPNVTTLRFGSGGHAFLAELPKVDLWTARNWLWARRNETGLFPVVVEESEAFLDDYDSEQEGSVSEILAAASALETDAVVDGFRKWGEDHLAEWRTGDYHRDLQIGPGDEGFWREDEGISEPRFFGPCCLALFPVRQASHVLAEVGWQPFNGSSAPEHVVMVSYFTDALGMELISISGDGYGLKMTDPIHHKHLASDVATILLGYADTAVSGTDRSGLSELASYLRVGRFLRPWWD